jgi:hypothetical protein
VWEYPLIASLAADSVVLPPQLPMDASFRFAVRRVTRVGGNAGLPLEDLGVRPDVVHHMTRKDVLEHNVDLINRAAAILRKRPWQRLAVTRASALSCRVTRTNIDEVDAYLGPHPLRSHRVKGSTFTLTLPCGGRGTRATLRLEGFRKGRLVAAARLALR